MNNNQTLTLHHREILNAKETPVLYMGGLGVEVVYMCVYACMLCVCVCAHVFMHARVRTKTIIREHMCLGPWLWIRPKAVGRPKSQGYWQWPQNGNHEPGLHQSLGRTSGLNSWYLGSQFCWTIGRRPGTMTAFSLVMLVKLVFLVVFCCCCVFFLFHLLRQMSTRCSLAKALSFWREERSH